MLYFIPYFAGLSLMVLKLLLLKTFMRNIEFVKIVLFDIAEFFTQLPEY